MTQPTGQHLRRVAAAVASVIVLGTSTGGSQTVADQTPNTLTPAERSEGWRLLFDGKTLDGWRAFTATAPPAGWNAIDGALARVGPGGDILTVDEFDSFELRLQWRISPGGNSGIFFHVGLDGEYVWSTGPEMQVLDNAGHADGKAPQTSAGSNYALHAPARDVTRPVGQWNDVRLLVKGPHVEHWLNDVKILEYELWSPDWEARVKASKFGIVPRYGRAKTGRIALQDHGDPVWYRSIKIRRL
jgi:Domain of Unknown Function (DUF1080)